MGRGEGRLSTFGEAEDGELEGPAGDDQVLTQGRRSLEKGEGPAVLADRTKRAPEIEAVLVVVWHLVQAGGGHRQVAFPLVLLGDDLVEIAAMQKGEPGQGRTAGRGATGARIGLLVQGADPTAVAASKQPRHGHRVGRTHRRVHRALQIEQVDDEAIHRRVRGEDVAQFSGGRAIDLEALVGVDG